MKKSNSINKNKIYLFFKRGFDIFFSLLAIVTLAPILLMLLLINLFVTRGHPVFKDKRVGKNSKDISVYKFRSMHFDAETNIDKYLTPEQIEIWKKERKVENDRRITSFGRFLRKTSLDELPQLFNILFGSMSIVGPRPCTRMEINRWFSDKEKEILFLARPGLTGYWQVNGRSGVTFESGKRQELEIEYFYKRGFWFDVVLVFKTIPAVFKSKGAQ